MPVDFKTWYGDLVDNLSDTLPDRFFTLRQFMTDSGLTEMTAARRLRQRVDAGELGTKLATVDGHEQRCYWPID